MSVIATPVKQTDAVRAADAVYLVDIATGLPVGGGAGGATVVAGQNGTTAATQLNPLPVTDAQGVIAAGSVTLVANTTSQIIGAFADRRGLRVLNYTASPVYLSQGTSGDPALGAGSDFIPAAVAGVPGQWEPPYAPVGGIRGQGASAGGLTVIAW